METNILIQRNLSLMGYEIAIVQRDRMKERFFVGEIIMKELDPGSVTPSTVISKESVQCLMDDIWSLGIRPTHSQDQKNIIQAKDCHINDLRKIAFKGLGLK